MGNSHGRRKERRLAERVVEMRSPHQSNKPQSKKPIDTWLQLSGTAVGLGLWLWPDKTPMSVSIALGLMFLCFIHPVWNFWWIEHKLLRRVVASIILCVLLVGYGWLAWPRSGSPIVSLPSDKSAITPEQLESAMKQAIAESRGASQPTRSNVEIEQPKSEAGPTGFLQLEPVDTQIVKVVADQPMTLIGHFMNRGQAPVSDARGLALLIFVSGLRKDVKDGVANKAFLDLVKKIWPTYKDKTQVGVGGSLYYPTSTSNPISKPQMDNIINGVDRIYLFSYAKWKGPNNSNEWRACSRLEVTPLNATDAFVYKWRVCDLN